jgi:NAD(P)-dependent dehydrogenase (short-subunit alcohol dehydrogenase family)
MGTGDVSTVVVTGGASGFGLAVAHRCAEEGMGVALLDIDGDRAAEAAAALGGRHDRPVWGTAVDVASEHDLCEAAAGVRERFGRCDLLWVNVAVQHFGAVETITDDEWHWALDVNVVGAARTVRAFLPLLRAAPRPRLAFTASANALAPAERLGVYQAAKYAVVGLAETLRMELAHEGIEVSIVYPSGMITRHLESSASARPASLGEPADISDDLAAMMASRPMGDADLATAEDAAAVAVAGVLAGEPHVITHGDLRAPVDAHQAEIRRALDLVEGRRDPSDGDDATAGITADEVRTR